MRTTTRALLLVLLPAMLGAGCATTPAPERRVTTSMATPETAEVRAVQGAAAAMGGMNAIRAVQTLSVEGWGEVFALGQNRTLESELLKWQVRDYRRTTDFRDGRWREESVQKPTFVTGWPDSFPAIAGYDADVAFDVDGGHASRRDASAARDRRAELYHHPIGFLQAASAEGARLAPARPPSEGIDLLTARGERFTLIVSPVTKLPWRILSKSYEPTLGDVTVATEFGDYARAGALQVPGRITKSIDGKVVSDLRLTKSTLDGLAASLEAPEEARTAAAKSPHITVEEAARGIWYVAGEGHHSVVVELADRVVLVEAPMDDARTLAVIAKARALVPGKPLTHVVNTHHHFDHAGGIRAAISEGLTVITHESNRRFFEDVAARPSTVVPDALAKHPRALSIETVAAEGSKTVGDGARRIEIYPVTGSTHCATMLMVYLPAERLLVEADAYQPPSPSMPPPVAHPYAKNLLENIEKRGLRVDRVLPIHGRMVPFAELVAVTRK